jgi:hypothetical protein
MLGVGPESIVMQVQYGANAILLISLITAGQVPSHGQVEVAASCKNDVVTPVHLRCAQVAAQGVVDVAVGPSLINQQVAIAKLLCHQLGQAIEEQF